MRARWVGVIGVIALVAACTGEAEETTTSATEPPTTIATTTTSAPTTTLPPETTTTEPAPPPEPELRSLVAPEAVITVDDDVSDWADVVGLSLTLEPIVERADDPLEDKDVAVRMAHDSDNLYMLVTVEDDYDWDADDAHLSGALAVMFPVESGSGPHMGAEDEEGNISAGMVDIWHWELDCAAGELNGGGAGHGPGEGDPGNDDVCNMDDEWATDAETREDDNSATGENSLTGVWWHSNPVEGEPGTWFFEMSRPLQNGDEQDGQFTVGESTLLALAYWDADYGPEGWDDSTHVQSSNQGWIQVTVR